MSITNYSNITIPSAQAMSHSRPSSTLMQEQALQLAASPVYDTIASPGQYSGPVRRWSPPQPPAQGAPPHYMAPPSHVTSSPVSQVSSCSWSLVCVL